MRQSTLKNVDRTMPQDSKISDPTRIIRRQELMSTDEKQQIPIDGFMRLPAVLSVFPVSKSTWWAGISEGRFPKGVKLGPRITAWKVEDIRRLIECLRSPNRS